MVVSKFLLNALKLRRLSVHKNPLVRREIARLKIKTKALGWGYRISGMLAKHAGSPYILFEDAFVRSLQPGYNGAVYGISADRSGAIFDAEHGCDLISLIAEKKAPRNETETLLSKFREHGISKYNWFCDVDISHYNPGILLVDQSRGDASMKYGGVTIEDFTRMFEDALREHPEDIIYIRTHPDQHFRDKKSCFSHEILNHKRVQILPSSIPPKQCFEFCHTVYTGTSLMGMEALIFGNRVITYGWNFYAGWGLTEDRSNFPKRLPRPHSVTLEQLFEAAYLDYCSYYDPNTGVACDLTLIIDHIALQKENWHRFSGSNHVLINNTWKRHLYELYLRGADSQTTFTKDIEELSHDARRRIVWGIKDEGVSFTRAEDGFLRSKGLGAGFNLPLSLVFDEIGIYFDATRTSRLEQILQNNTISSEQEQQAQELINIIVEKNLTKYNFPLTEASLPPQAKGKHVILVPGQVEDDASIRLGSPKVKSNAQLLQLVRQANPHAYICFKPHPDLTSHLRKGRALSSEIAENCDHIILEGDLISWVKIVDEVHTMTSTVGFEALLHQKPVTTYGMPFYAGWGLTTDHETCSRRTKTLRTVDLVYGALIKYPTYLNPNTGEYITATTAAKLLADPEFTTAKPKWAWRALLTLKKVRNK